MSVLRTGRRWLGAHAIEIVAVSATAVALAVATTWPLALLLDDHAHDPFDPLFQAWTLDWAQYAFFSDAPLWDANIFLGHPRTLAYTDALLGAAVVLLPFRWLGLSPIGVHNVGLLLGYASSAAAGYVFGRMVTRSRVVGASTAVVYAFGSFNTFLGQHMNVVMHPGPALAAAAAWALADRSAGRRPTFPSLAALTAVVALQGTVSFYTAALSLVAAGAVLLARWRDLRLRDVAGAVGAMVVAIVLLLPFAWPYILNARQMGDEFRWTLADLGALGADFTKVDPSLTVWGSTLPNPRGIFGEPAFPGVTMIVLTALGLWSWRRAEDRRSHLVALTLAVVGFILSIGTSDSGWRRYTPYRLVYELVPGGAALRATGRFWLVGLLGVGLLVGFAVRWLTDAVTSSVTGGGRGRRWAGAGIAALCLGLVLVEGHRSWSGSPEIKVQAVDRALARLPDDGGVAYLPLPRSPDDGFLPFGQAKIVYRSTAHHRRILNGYAAFYPKDFFRVGAPIETLPDARALDHLRRIGVRYVVVPPDAGPWQALRDPAAAAPLRLIGDYDGDLLFEVPEP